MFKDNIIAHAYIGQNSADLDNGLLVVRNYDDDTVAEVAARGDGCTRYRWSRILILI